MVIMSPALQVTQMPIAVFALALAAFCIGSTEFIVSGILLAVSDDLSKSLLNSPAGISMFRKITHRWSTGTGRR